jgi:hypothetical protein
MSFLLVDSGCGWVAAQLPSGLPDRVRESFHMVSVGTGNEVTVEVHGDLDRGVPELFRDVDDGHAAAEHQRSIGVAIDGGSLSGLACRSPGPGSLDPRGGR